MILIDLQKAFDTENHNTLLKKIEFIGFSEETTKWFKPYLLTRKFKVHIKSTFSEPGNLKWSSSRIHFRITPFFLYINDMPQAVNCELLLYADDTCLICQH